MRCNDVNYSCVQTDRAYKCRNRDRLPFFDRLSTRDLSTEPAMRARCDSSIGGNAAASALGWRIGSRDTTWLSASYVHSFTNLIVLSLLSSNGLLKMQLTRSNAAVRRAVTHSSVRWRQRLSCVAIGP